MLSQQFPVPLRRKLLNHILGSAVSLATDPAGSHIIDACWGATENIRHYRDKLAAEMAAQEDTVRNDFFGKNVWRNWNMHGFIHQRFDWGKKEGDQERKYAKMPVVKKKVWQRPEGQGQQMGRGIVTKRSSMVKS
jgi:nucleolar protein 9